MATWGNICRICSSPADYEVFAKIPNYLHATSNEFLNWQKPINVLLEETTGLKVSIEDSLPRYMCALCISYLKHAVTFREQAINNALGLKAVQAAIYTNIETTVPLLQQQDKASLLITANDLSYSEERKTDTNLLYSSEQRDKVRKQLLNSNSHNNNSSNNITETTTAQDALNMDTEQMQLRYLNMLFNKDTNSGGRSLARQQRLCDSERRAYNLNSGGGGSDPFAEDFQTASSDDQEASEQKQNFFTYREKNFEEDDVMDMAELRDAISISIPESCKERKCRACFRRFMFEESYKEHMKTCIEYKFLLTIEEINRLLDIRRGKAISPHEFIRRMIFCLRKTCEWLKANCGEMLLPDLLMNSDAAKKQRLASEEGEEEEGKSSTAEASSGGAGGDGGNKTEKLFAEKTFAAKPSTEKTFTVKLAAEKSSEKSTIIKNKSNMTEFTFKSAPLETLPIINLFSASKTVVASRSSTPISVENNILYEIERTQSRHKPVQSNGPPQDQERLTFLQKLQNATSTKFDKEKTFPILNDVSASPIIAVRKDLLPTTSSKPVTPSSSPAATNLLFSARCNLCNTGFVSVVALEKHNAMYHNAEQQLEQLQLVKLPVDLQHREINQQQVLKTQSAELDEQKQLDKQHLLEKQLQLEMQLQQDKQQQLELEKLAADAAYNSERERIIALFEESSDD